MVSDVGDTPLSLPTLIKFSICFYDALVHSLVKYKLKTKTQKHINSRLHKGLLLLLRMVKNAARLEGSGQLTEGSEWPTLIYYRMALLFY